ncbi:MAG: hypothetical protein AAF927_24095 [Bacteroidota bacterium]
MKLALLALILLLQLPVAAFSQESTPDRISRIVLNLNQKLNERAELPLPAVVYHAELDANARYENDTIWIGQIQAEFKTDDDWMSIIYHEYWHYLHEGIYRLGRDSAGQIVQWDTDQWYTYQPSEYRIKRVLEQYEATLVTVGDSFANREKLLEDMRKTVSQPQQLPFIYAPSNLSLEEIKAYEAQLEAEQAGYYQLSTAARNAILERISQQKDTYQRRKAYEVQMGLGPDGLAIRKP